MTYHSHNIMNRETAKGHRIFKNISQATSESRSATRAGHVPSKRTTKKLKDKGSSPDNIVQVINRATTGISSMHIDHKVDRSNRET